MATPLIPFCTRIVTKLVVFATSFACVFVSRGSKKFLWKG